MNFNFKKKSILHIFSKTEPIWNKFHAIPIFAIHPKHNTEYDKHLNNSDSSTLDIPPFSYLIENGQK